MTPRPRTLPKVETADKAEDERHRKEHAFLNPILACPLLYGVLVSGEVPEFTPATVTLRHNLGRLPVGWFHVGAKEGTALVETERTDTTITFEQGTGAGVDTPFTLWVF